MIVIDEVWKVSDELSKLQTVSLDNEKWVRLEDVLKIMRDHTVMYKNLGDTLIDTEVRR